MNTTNVNESIKLSVSPSPFVHDHVQTARIIWTVFAALLPAAFLGIVSFGVHAAYVIIVCIATAITSEYVYRKLLKKTFTISDGSAALTGLLLAFNLPPGIPLPIAAIGTFVAIVLVKQLFGGLGFNIFNPALLGRAFLQVSFPVALSTWTAPIFAFGGLDAHTSATPLTVLKKEGVARLYEIFGTQPHIYFEMLFGHRGGCIGENALLALLAGGIFLIALRYITWHIPVSFIGSAAIMAWIFGGQNGFFTGDPLFHLLCGGIIMGSFFMATDYVTSPIIRNAKIVFGIGCGVLTMVIRFWGGYPEGVMFAILIMNCFAPLIDRAFKMRVFGIASSNVKKRDENAGSN